MFKFMCTKGLPVGVNIFGNVGGALFSGIWGATHAQDTSALQDYKLQQSFKRNEDYLACVMDAQVSNAVYQLNQRMDDDHIDNFNQAVAAVLTSLEYNCPAHNCINASTIDPSQRNQRMNATCVSAYKPTNPKTCIPKQETLVDPWTMRPFTIDKGWDPNDIVQCQGYDQFGSIYDGVCGGSDGLCYHSDVGFKGTTEFYRELKDMFLTKDSINMFHAFDDLYNPSAVVAYAKGAVVYLGLLQELYFLGASAEETVMKQFTMTSATWLQSRVDYHTNVNVSLQTVQDASRRSGDTVSIRWSCQPRDEWGQCRGGCGAEMMDAATKLAAKNMQLFNQSGVLDTIASLRKMAALKPTMPPDTFDMYKTKFTPRWACTSGGDAPPGLLQSARSSMLLPVWEREEKLNIHSGSVVIRRG